MSEPAAAHTSGSTVPQEAAVLGCLGNRDLTVSFKRIERYREFTRQSSPHKIGSIVASLTTRV